MSIDREPGTPYAGPAYRPLSPWGMHDIDTSWRDGRLPRQVSMLTASGAFLGDGHRPTAPPPPAINLAYERACIELETLDEAHAADALNYPNGRHTRNLRKAMRRPDIDRMLANAFRSAIRAGHDRTAIEAAFARAGRRVPESVR